MNSIWSSADNVFKILLSDKNILDTKASLWHWNYSTKHEYEFTTLHLTDHNLLYFLHALAAFTTDVQKVFNDIVPITELSVE